MAVRAMATRAIRKAQQKWPVEHIELLNALKKKDADNAMRLLTSCDQPPPRSLYNRLLALVETHPEHMALVHEHMASAGVNPDESTLTLHVRAQIRAGELQSECHR